MTSLLIDTNIYSYAMRGDPAVVTALQRADRVAISAVSIGELLAGFRAGSSEQRNRQELAEFLDVPRVTLLPVTDDTAEFYAAIHTTLRQAGTPVPTHDLWIAALALQHGLRLYTRDPHFARIPGLLLLG